jgi:hypothetical protein
MVIAILAIFFSENTPISNTNLIRIWVKNRLTKRRRLADTKTTKHRAAPAPSSERIFLCPVKYDIVSYLVKSESNSDLNRGIVHQWI